LDQVSDAAVHSSEQTVLTASAVAESDAAKPPNTTTANAAASLAVATTGSARGSSTNAGAKNTGIQLSNRVAPGASSFLWIFSPIEPVAINSATKAPPPANEWGRPDPLNAGRAAVFLL
jgi:hypothetical protein